MKLANASLVSLALSAGALGALLVSPALAAPAGSTGSGAVAAARDIVAKNQDSVVTITAVLKLSPEMAQMAGGAQEMKIETLGTIIHATGLTVASQVMLDPPSAYSSMRGRAEGGKSEFADVKIRLADGTEVPAKVVLSDSDLDLAFILPDASSEEAKKQGGKFAHVDLASGPEAALLDDVVSLSRESNLMDRQVSAAMGHIASVVHKPRTFYQADANAMLSYGTPVFTGEGKILGIAVIRKREGQQDASSRVYGEKSFESVILPASDVQQVADQALAAKAEDKKSE